MSDVQIKRASNNAERQDTYRTQLGRYSRAMKEGFYFEALLITYSLLEDRLKAFLYYCGFFDNRNTLKVSKKCKNDIGVLVLDKNQARWPSFRYISTKIDSIEKLLCWVESIMQKDIEGNLYYSCLKHSLESVDTDALLKALIELRSWIKYRNEVMHASMNKNIDSLYSELSERVAEGMDLARFIDSQVRIIKKYGTVRKTMKMQNN